MKESALQKRMTHTQLKSVFDFKKMRGMNVDRFVYRLIRLHRSRFDHMCGLSRNAYMHMKLIRLYDLSLLR